VILRIGGTTCFKTLYRCARTAALHETGPVAQSHLAYLEHLARGSATIHCRRANAGVLYRAAFCMNLDDTSPVERSAVKKAAMEWAQRKFLNAMASSPEPTEKKIQYITCRWLRFPPVGPSFRCSILVSMRFSETTESSPIAHTQFLHWRHSLHLPGTDLALPTTPPPSATDGSHISWLTIRICYSLLTRLPP